ncbi:isotrichodermin C-15 hydroxylase [Podospora aff. communis PSN243]|uniref:Isotrichodermin C-15 hydroxylase n=1 Tax=Podospora aff. communis PSN243 TaxID=3040156 RepID=A0AAV9GP67_9PEZI|nr:isotrichodermin C-15 hydroxylase [Podospora aff. communis PSN243]
MPAILDFIGVSAPGTSTLVGTVLGMVLAWQVYTVIYNLFFHPLRDFPGPLLQRASSLPWALQNVRGVQAFHTQQLHDKYGPVVRITPQHLSFTEASAWRDIYGHLIGHKSGAQEMSKLKALVKAIDSVPASILNSDREEHGRFRRALSHGFSDSSMREQERTLIRFIDLLVRRIHEEADNGRKALNAEAWYNWTTFDITGELIFGEAFGCLQSSKYHAWIEFVFGTVKWGMGISTMSYIGLHWLVQVLYQYAGSGKALARVREYTRAMLEKRMEMPEGREDLFEGLVRRRDEWGISFEKLSANAFILILAGSETTATTLSGATYFLLTNPDALSRLQHEVWSTFKSADEINIASVGKLSYMLAVLNEALRMYPPVTSNLVRVVPSGGAQIAGHFVPGGTYVEVQHWSINHSSDNFKDPWEFNPDRFINPAEGEVLEALQAFSVGPRNCIGRNLAYAEMRIILARLVYDFDMKLAPDSKNWVERQKTYTLWDRMPLNVYFTPVQRG